MKALFSAVALLGLCSCAESQKYPNIIYILADDMGYGDIQRYNPSSKIPTPVLDSLASCGISFIDAHSNSAVSTPTRYGTLTGQYSFRSSLKKGVLTGYSSPLIVEGTETVASLLQQHGYRTACVGKWHLGLNWTRRDTTQALYEGDEWNLGKSNVDYSALISGGPTDCGFDYSYIIPASLDMPPYLYIENGRATSAQMNQAPDYRDEHIRGAFYRHGDVASDFDHTTCLQQLTLKSEQFIERAAHADQPYFLYFALTAPHSPWFPDDANQGRSQAGAYGDFVSMVDDVVGEICTAVRQSGKADNTIIIFASDNGSMWKDADILATGHQSNGAWSGAKSDLWEGGHRVPFIVNWPKKIKSAVKSHQLICSTDLFATLQDMLHLDRPSTAIDSRSFWRVLSGEGNQNLRNGMVYHSVNGYFAYREGDWVLVDCKGSGGWALTEEAAADSLPLQLYNLKTDTLQRRNLCNVYPERVQAMKLKLEEVKQRKVANGCK